MDREAILKTYRRYARGYDLYFGALFQPGCRGVIARMHCQPGERILEVGVGTGCRCRCTRRTCTSPASTFRRRCSRGPSPAGNASVWIT